MELDPGVAAEDMRPADGVPGGDRERQEGERGAEARCKGAKHARAERHADDQVERDRRPRRELDDFEPVAERAAARGMAPQAEPDELEYVAREDRHIDGGAWGPSPAQEGDRAQEHAGDADQLVWRPLIAWSDNFKFEQVELADRVTSPILELLRRSNVFSSIPGRIFARFDEPIFKHMAQKRDNRSEEHTSELQSPCNLVCR